MKKLTEVHVVIYGNKMLKEAVSRLTNQGKKVEESIFDDFKIHENCNLIFHEEEFKVVQSMPEFPNYEISLNDLMEMIISEETLKVGDWAISNHGKDPLIGKVTQLSRTSAIISAAVTVPLSSLSKLLPKDLDAIKEEILECID